VRDWVIDVQGGTVDTAPPTVRTYPAAGAGVDTSIPLGFGRGVEEAPEASEGPAFQAAANSVAVEAGTPEAGPRSKSRWRVPSCGGEIQVAVEISTLRQKTSGCGEKF
jgi:hypothetical protein